MYSERPETRSDSMAHEKYRWLLVDGFVDEFNKHRLYIFIPSDLICIDKTISRWYGQGRHWINLCLHMYMLINMNPENF